MSGILSEMTMPEVREFVPEVVTFAVGSTEPHGPALPYGTDFFRGESMCRRATELANQRGARVLMYPTLPIGNNVNFKPFPFACRVSVRTLMLTLLDIIEALEEDGIRKIVIVNTHGGNTDAIQATLREHYDRTPAERRAFVCMSRGMIGDRARGLIEHGSPHAGEAETSQILHLHPDLVRAERLRNMPIAEPFEGLEMLERAVFVRPWERFVPDCGGGNVEHASAEKGRRLIEGEAEGLAEFYVALCEVPWQPGFPYPKTETGEG